MDEVERACEILTEAKWRGLVWKPDTLSGCKYIGADSENAGNLNTFTLTVDAIAIATGIIAHRELAALRKAASLVVKTCHADSMGYLYKLRRLLAAYEQKEGSDG